MTASGQGIVAVGLVASAALVVLCPARGAGVGTVVLWVAGWINNMLDVAAGTVTWDASLLWAVFGWLAAMLYVLVVRALDEAFRTQIVRPVLRIIHNTRS